MKALIGVLALVVVLALAVAGCGSSGGDDSVAELGTTSASESAAPEAEGASPEEGGEAGEATEGGGEDTALEYTECMRENGIADFPEPVEGQIRIHAGPGSDLNPGSPAFQKAEEACRSLAPAHEADPGQEDELSESALAYSACMRENGVPDFPDPQVSGGKVQLGIPRGVDPNSAAFKGAEEACRELMLGGPGGPGGTP
jgi:hypothetical protein